MKAVNCKHSKCKVQFQYRINNLLCFIFLRWLACLLRAVSLKLLMIVFATIAADADAYFFFFLFNSLCCRYYYFYDNFLNNPRIMMFIYTQFYVSTNTNFSHNFRRRFFLFLFSIKMEIKTNFL